MSNTTEQAKRSLLQDVIAKCSDLYLPLQATLELTYRCNLRCVHCYVDDRESGELTFDEWKEVLDQLESAGTAYLLFTGGEITVRDDFLNIATQARRMGFFIALLTNCTLVTHEVARTIAELRPFVLGTSLYGATATSHELVTKVPGSFDRTIEGIRSLIGAGLVPVVQIAVTKTNVAELPRIESLVKSLGAMSRHNVGMSPSKTGADFPFQHEPGIEELLGCSWAVDDKELTTGSGPDICKAGKGVCAVSPWGEVSPCIMFPLKMGNLRESSFQSIWRLEPCAELRYLRSMRRSDLSACINCELKAYCQRCTGSAYLEWGRMDGLSPSACRQARRRWRLTLASEVK
ncbi:MAG: radical SAM protein [Dehalococcoidales bacterium]|nr:MAG: radical SAM protein [Dehalococcoidales bacterium]